MKVLEKTMIVLIVVSLLVMCVLIIAVAIPPDEHVPVEEEVVAPTETTTINPVPIETPGYVCREDCDCMEETIPSTMPSGGPNSVENEFPIVTV